MMSGGKPVFVGEMYFLRARMRAGSVHSMAPCPREEPSLSWRLLVLDRAGQVRMACGKESGSSLHRGQVVSGF